MSLSDEQIAQGQKYLKAWQQCTSLPMASHHLVFAQTIEVDVRKDYDALIRQMLEALAKASVALRIGHDELVAIDETAAAITAARERLGDEPAKAQPAIHPATVAACIARLEQGGQSAAVSILRHHFEQKGG